jgi:hypothetical protein
MALKTYTLCQKSVLSPLQTAFGQSVAAAYVDGLI